MKYLIATALFLLVPLYKLSSQELDFKELDLPYWSFDDIAHIIKSETEYLEFIREYANSFKVESIDFDNYFLVGYHGTGYCDPPAIGSTLNVFQDNLTISMFIGKSYCLAIIPFQRWFLVNKKFIDKKIKIKVIEVDEQLTEIKTNCYFQTDFEEKSLIVKSSQEYRSAFTVLDKPCLSIDFDKYSLIAECTSIAGCGYPTITKTATTRNDSLIVHSTVTQVGLCERANHLYSTFIIEKSFLDKSRNISFTKEVVVDWR
mgnify:CR=1 FL=1|tara:strand:- start:2755 stop:3531 length:777 start_codon:yes stop_codon:yes gene_type:complete